MIFKYLAVEKTPKQLEPGTVYHNSDFELAALLCACGCGHRVNLMVPDGHRVTSSQGLATVTPSIAVCDGPCKSHYFITNGHVEWLPAFSEAQASAVMHQPDCAPCIAGQAPIVAASSVGRDNASDRVAFFVIILTEFEMRLLLEPVCCAASGDQNGRL